jgi:D-alanyl-D-alanine carboxypeptidase
MRANALIGFIALLIATSPAMGSDLASDLERILADFLAENPQAPGIAASAVCPALGLDWSAAVGHVAHGSREPLTANHTFRMASNTKTYVAAAVLRLVEDGRLDLQASLAEVLPSAPAALLAGDGYDLHAITLQQVLGHTAGLADHTGDDRYGEAIIADPGHGWTALEQIRRCVELFDPLGPPGQQYVYSDTGYVLLGTIIEDACGQPLGPAVRALLDLDGLGLRATWWEEQEAPAAGAGPRAHQYIGGLDTTSWNPSFDLYGGGGLVSDVHDLGRFMRFLLQGRVLRREDTLATMTGAGTPGYRLGLMGADLAGHLALGHQGFWNTFAFQVPGLDATVAGCILSHDAANGRELAARLVARLAAEQP